MAKQKPKDIGDIVNDATSALESAGGTSQTGYAPPTRNIFENGQWKPYDGPGLVDASGNILLDASGNPYYYDDTAAGTVYSALSPANQVKLMEKLASAGFISQNAIGDFSSELSAVQQWLLASNMAGLEKNNFLNQRLAGRTAPNVGGGAGRTYRKTNPDDLKAIARQVAQQTLGRAFTDDEANRFVEVFQQQEVSAQRRAAGGGTMVDSPAADVAAEQFAEEQAPTEASAYKTLGYINKFFSAIGGGV